MSRSSPSRSWRVNRDLLRWALAVLWLLDAALQCQPFMFSRSFATEVLDQAGDGQPVVVAGPVHAMAALVASHPVLFNAPFAIAQFLLAIGLVFRRTAKPALVASIGWSLVVWWLGEGFGGLLSGHSMLLTGAPGAVVLYAALAVAAWPRPGGDGDTRINERLAIGIWSGLWVVGALLQVLPGQNSGEHIAAAIRNSAGDAPNWLRHFDTSLAGGLPHGMALAVALAVIQTLIGVAVLVSGFARTAAVTAGLGLAAGYWVSGQALGGLSTGQATDPNTAPLIIVLGLVIAAGVGLRGQIVPTVASFTKPVDGVAVSRYARLTR